MSTSGYILGDFVRRPDGRLTAVHGGGSQSGRYSVYSNDRSLGGRWAGIGHLNSDRSVGAHVDGYDSPNRFDVHRVGGRLTPIVPEGLRATIDCADPDRCDQDWPSRTISIDYSVSGIRESICPGQECSWTYASDFTISYTIPGKPRDLIDGEGWSCVEGNQLSYCPRITWSLNKSGVPNAVYPEYPIGDICPGNVDDDFWRLTFVTMTFDYFVDLQMFQIDSFRVGLQRINEIAGLYYLIQRVDLDLPVTRWNNRNVPVPEVLGTISNLTANYTFTGSNIDYLFTCDPPFGNYTATVDVTVT